MQPLFYALRHGDPSAMACVWFNRLEAVVIYAQLSTDQVRIFLKEKETAGIVCTKDCFLHSSGLLVLTQLAMLTGPRYCRYVILENGLYLLLNCASKPLQQRQGFQPKPSWPVISATLHTCVQTHWHKRTLASIVLWKNQFSSNFLSTVSWLLHSTINWFSLQFYLEINLLYRWTLGLWLSATCDNHYTAWITLLALMHNNCQLKLRLTPHSSTENSLCQSHCLKSSRLSLLTKCFDTASSSRPCIMLLLLCRLCRIISPATRILHISQITTSSHNVFHAFANRRLSFYYLTFAYGSCRPLFQAHSHLFATASQKFLI